MLEAHVKQKEALHTCSYIYSVHILTHMDSKGYCIKFIIFDFQILVPLGACYNQGFNAMVLQLAFAKAKDKRINVASLALAASWEQQLF